MPRPSIAAAASPWLTFDCVQLTPEVVSELLSDSDFCPGARPVCFAAGEHTSWIFKEGPGFHTRKKAASGRGADRWCVRPTSHTLSGWSERNAARCRHNSGGAKAARKLPQENPVVCRRCARRPACRLRLGLTEFVLRRYGSLAQQNGQKFRYHEYCLVTPTDQNDYIEERGVCSRLPASALALFVFLIDRLRSVQVTLFHLMLPTPPSPRVSPAPSSRGRSRSRPVRTQI